MLANLAFVRGALGKFDAAFENIRRGKQVQQAKPEEMATLKATEAILLSMNGKAPEAVQALKRANSKYYTAAEAALDPRLKKISMSKEFEAYLVENRSSAG
jgi:hypothetical protein